MKGRAIGREHDRSIAGGADAVRPLDEPVFGDDGEPALFGGEPLQTGGTVLVDLGRELGKGRNRDADVMATTVTQPSRKTIPTPNGSTPDASQGMEK